MNDYWFKPKTFGYGATPINWKGWAATLGFVLAMVGLSLSVFGVTKRTTVPLSDWAIWLAGVITLTGAFIAISKRKTDGEWKWRGWDRGQ